MGKNLSAYAFYACPGVTNVTILNGPTTLGEQAFAGCDKTVRLMIPTSVTAIVVSADNAWPSSVHGVLFDKNQTTLVGYPAAKSAGYVIPDAVSIVGELAFADCDRLTSVTIPDSVVTIRTGAFRGCPSLTRVYFEGDAPVVVGKPFEWADNATVYYLPGKTGFGASFAGRPVLLWNSAFTTLSAAPPNVSCPVTGTANIPLALETTTHPLSGSWARLYSTNLAGGGRHALGPRRRSRHAARFYRIAGP